jgi:uncharacterized protein involved in exopolysaccharide biosynthesis
LIDFRDLFLRFRWLLLGAPVAGAIVMIAISFLVTPQYRVTALLAPVENSPNSTSLASLGGALGGLGTLAGINLGGDSSRNESIAVLTSKALTTGYMQDKNLLPVLFASDWDKQQGQWTVEAHDIPTLEDGYRVFNEDIRSVVSDRETGLVTLTVTWSDREQAAEWANQLVERANNVIRTRAIDEYERSIEYLNEELEKTTVVGVRQAIYSVIESQIEQVMLANVRTDYAFKVLDPAVTPEADDEVFPSRALFALAGLILGFVLAAALALSRLR